MTDNPPTPSSDDPAPSEPNPAAAMPMHMRPVRPEGFNGAVLVAVNGEVILSCDEHGLIAGFINAWCDDYLEAVEAHAYEHAHAVDASMPQHVTLAELFDDARTERRLGSLGSADRVPLTDELEHLAKRRRAARTPGQLITADALLINALLVALEFAMGAKATDEPEPSGTAAAVRRRLSEPERRSNALPDILREQASYSESSHNGATTILTTDTLRRLADRIEDKR